MKFYRILFLLFLFLVFCSGIYVVYTNKINIHYESKPTNNQYIKKIPANCPDTLINNNEKEILLYNSTNGSNSPNKAFAFNNLDDYINYLEIRKNLGEQCPILSMQKGQKMVPHEIKKEEDENNVGSSYNTNNNTIHTSTSAATTNNHTVENKKENKSISDVLHNVKNSIMQSSQSNVSNQSQQVNNSLFTVDANSDVAAIIDASREDPPFNANQYPGFDSFGLQVGIYNQLDKTHDATKLQQPNMNAMDPNWAIQDATVFNVKEKRNRFEPTRIYYK